MQDFLCEDELSKCRKYTFAFCAIAIFILLTYSNTFHASWQYDDFPNIVERADLHLKALTWPEIKGTFTDNDQRRFYRPISSLSFAINYFLFNLNVFYYHLINIIIHFITAFTLFLVIYNLINLPLLMKYKRYQYLIALLSSILWLINPIQTQGVTYIVQRMTSLAAMFYILSIFFYLKRRIAKNIRKIFLSYCLCFIFALMSFGSKENTVMLPASILLLDLLLIQGISRKSLKRCLIIGVLCIGIPVFFGLLMIPSLFDPEKIIGSYDHRFFTVFDRILTQPRVLVFYLSLLFYPMPNRLCLIHDLSISTSLFSPWTTIPSILLIFIIIFIAIYKAKKYPLISFCILFYFINQMIESSFLNLEIAYEHRNYLPSMFIFILISLLFINLIKYFSANVKMQLIIISAIVLIIIGHAHSTYVRNYIWLTEESLWLDAVDKNPQSKRAYTNLGRAYSAMGHYETAIEQYNKVFDLPRDSQGMVEHITHFNLAINYKKLGKIDKQIIHLKKTIELDPNFIDAYHDLAVAHFKLKKYKKSYDYFKIFLKYKPESISALANFASVLIALQKYDDALNILNDLLKKNQLSPRFNHNIALVFKYKNNYFMADKYFNIAIKYNKNKLLSYLHRSENLLLMGEKESAVHVLLDAIKYFGSQSVLDSIKSYRENESEEIMPQWRLVLPLLEQALYEYADSIEKIFERIPLVHSVKQVS